MLIVLRTDRQCRLVVKTYTEVAVETVRVFSIGDERIGELLLGQDQARREERGREKQEEPWISHVGSRGEIRRATEDGLVLLVNPSARLNAESGETVYPSLFLDEYRELILRMLRREDPPFARRPWLPASILHIDPDLQGRSMLSMPQWCLFRHAPSPMDWQCMLGKAIPLHKALSTVRKALYRKLSLERVVAEKGIHFPFAMEPREQYIEILLRSGLHREGRAEEG